MTIKSKKTALALTSIVWIAGFASAADVSTSEDSNYRNNRAPLAAKAYVELPLGTIKPQGWLKEQLERMARGLTGRLDALYPEVVGPRNGWLGGDGDGWERGPYWIDGLVPLAYLLDDASLHAKAKPWIEWTLTHQQSDGYLGPLPFNTPPAHERGLQKEPRRDWWPKMVMLKVLVQHYSATGDERVIAALTSYFRYQLNELPKTPLNRWTAWARMRGGENLDVVYWLYNITGDAFLLELGDLLYQQTHPFTDSFLARKQLALHRQGGTSPHGGAFHCVDLAQGIKTPIVRYQADRDERHLRAVQYAFEDIERYHGQPYGLYGGDEGMHGRQLTRGSELCTAVEMMFSLERMLEITGNLDFADRLEIIAFNALPTQASDDYMTRQYFQQANQIACTLGDRNFFNDDGDRVVYGLLSGYPCCTCNMHQGWPKLVQHLWMATADGGLAALVYGPSSVTAQVADGCKVTIDEVTTYPFEEQVRFTLHVDAPVTFPLHLRVPSWCHDALVSINNTDDLESTKRDGNLLIVKRTWQDGDVVTLKLPATVRTRRWEENSVSVYRGPLLFALPLDEQWSQTDKDVREVRSTDRWNYAILEGVLNKPNGRVQVVTGEKVPKYPWTKEHSAISITVPGFEHPAWSEYRGSAGPIPWSPQPVDNLVLDRFQPLTLIPYGCTTLRIAAFPTFKPKPLHDE